MIFLSINPGVLLGHIPSGSVGAAYSFSLPTITDGGIGPFTFSVYDGFLPTGLSLSAAGTISGTPSTAGVYYFVLQITGADERVYLVQSSITIRS